ncbi:UDP-N-acetylglucosamine 1-carboxyvinyltransferase [Flavonifractor sp. An92]|uniref:UDP-N-acetylglucosamine 1-carboxyvinyltransferase n=1 Tax=Flavonifractor sp. An92 TaxID=1965666 RepID=UPI000B39517A|nr:UDP-N-acetylglucosamine 1-carboxyvinyltransferase [Flavonifractor sp. An92]OUN07646.1 UDP-N-acetylglucosamine 1-carboxyvinyltransferase [Flavonifractor sp. An92]
MQAIIVEGGRPLVGGVEVHGAKNSVLPILAAAILAPGKSVIHNCPPLSDVAASLDILRHLGCRAEQHGTDIEVDASTLTGSSVPDALMREMRSSVIFLGGILGRTGEAELTFPGGCELGPRPIDLHLSAIRALGADVQGAGTSTILIRGGKPLHGGEYTVVGDRIVACTYLAAAAAAGGAVTVTGADPRHFSTVTAVLAEAGCTVRTGADWVELVGREGLQAVRPIHTAPYPGFPTDAQPPVMAALARGRGTTLFVEHIFENRYRHAQELCRMGADIKVEGRVAAVSGVRSLHGAAVEAADLRGAAALLVAALGAEGESSITGLKHLDRGYAGLERDLTALGGRVRRVEQTPEG